MEQARRARALRDAEEDRAARARLLDRARRADADAQGQAARRRQDVQVGDRFAVRRRRVRGGRGHARQSDRRVRFVRGAVVACCGSDRRPRTFFRLLATPQRDWGARHSLHAQHARPTPRHRAPARSRSAGTATLTGPALGRQTAGSRRATQSSRRRRSRRARRRSPKPRASGATSAQTIEIPSPLVIPIGGLTSSSCAGLIPRRIGACAPHDAVQHRRHSRFGEIERRSETNRVLFARRAKSGARKRSRRSTRCRRESDTRPDTTDIRARRR